MKLNKRDCEIRIRVTPCSGDFQKIQWSIGDDHHILWPSAVMGGQFSKLITAAYCLYAENGDAHTNCISRRQYSFERGTPNVIKTSLRWDEEGRMVDITLIRYCTDFKDPFPNRYDPIEIELCYWRGKFHYTVDGRELCYALSKAATAALKKYGFRGYHCTSGSNSCYGDSIIVEQLLFLKAYAMNVMETRELKQVWKTPGSWMHAEGTSLEKELELLLFDM